MYQTVNTTLNQKAYKFWIAGLNGNYTLLTEIYNQSSYAERRKLVESHNYGFSRESTDKDNANITMLHIAVERGDIQLVDFLLTTGADLNAKMYDGSTPLIMAAEYGFTNICKLLLHNGADPNIVDSRDRSAVLYAALHQNFELIKLLLDNGCNVPGHLLAGYNNLIMKEEMKELIKSTPKRQLNLDGFDEWGNTALHYSALDTNIEVIRLLLSKGAKVNAANKYGEIPLCFALRRNSTESCIELIRNGSNIGLIKCRNADQFTTDYWNSPGIQLATVIQIASEMKNIDLIKLLLQNGDDFSFPDFIHRFYTDEDVGVVYLEEFVREFPVLRSRINKNDYSGYTALHYAVESANIDVINQLLLMGANIAQISTDYHNRNHF